MLNSIPVTSFKSLESVEVELGLVNVFVGANGSGKSNLLEAIGVLAAAANGRDDDEALLRRGVRPGLSALYKSSFRGSHQAPEIQLRSRSEDAEFAVGLYNPLRDPEQAWRFKTDRIVEGGVQFVDRSPRSKLNLAAAAGLTALKGVEFPVGGQQVGYCQIYSNMRSILQTPPPSRAANSSSSWFERRTFGGGQ